MSLPKNDVLGKLRSYRLFHIAIFDVLATISGALLMWKCLTYYTRFKLSFLFVICCVFGIGIVSHRVFGIRTTVDRFLFP